MSPGLCLQTSIIYTCIFSQDYGQYLFQTCPSLRFLLHMKPPVLSHANTGTMWSPKQPWQLMELHQNTMSYIYIGIVLPQFLKTSGISCISSALLQYNLSFWYFASPGEKLLPLLSSSGGSSDLNWLKYSSGNIYSHDVFFSPNILL